MMIVMMTLSTMDGFREAKAGNGLAPVRTAKNPGGQEIKHFLPTAAEPTQEIFFWQQRGAEIAGLLPSIKTFRPKTNQVLGLCVLGFLFLHGCQLSFISTYQNLRSRKAEVESKLRTIHPNPGPGRDKTEEGKQRRRERRYKKREERRVQRIKVKDKIIRIATWNVQGMSMGTMNKRKLRDVVKYAEKNKWEVTLLSEVKAKERGTVWLGEGENLAAVTYTNKAAILLRGNALAEWCRGGQITKIQGERNIAVKLSSLFCVATYQPVYRGNNNEIIEATKEELRLLAKQASKDDVLIIGGDYNAHIGGGEARAGVCGGFGLRESNEQGRLLLEWLEENDLTYVNSFFQHKRRGTWYSIPLRRWYEIDGFIMRNGQRHKYVKKVSTVGEASISDHKPKLMKIELKENYRKERIRR